ncbi:hypothetical protein I0Q91_12265 [Halanaerobiaceae bacterium Z-7014]|uniref:Uncharacterized protein n=1 Tax=Halonatronomonas betaini TaxID=2778430 RepID=A0A931F9R5_9FIRM|nr:hypothetical protein [Halonatronomonas betaini]MBF8437863.1 hypothetical protein [Halonatronomonas betaini]
MRKDHDWLLDIIKSARQKINKRIKRLKAKLGLVKKQKKELAETELKLRSMRAIATKIRDEDLDDSEQKQLVARFNDLQKEIQQREGFI